MCLVLDIDLCEDFSEVRGYIRLLTDYHSSLVSKLFGFVSPPSPTDPWPDLPRAFPPRPEELLAGSATTTAIAGYTPDTWPASPLCMNNTQ